MSDKVYMTQGTADDLVQIISVLAQLLHRRMVICPPTEEEQQRIRYVEKLTNSIRSDIEKQNI